MRLHGLPYATNVGTINGGLWSSSVMDSLAAKVRVGVSLNETIDQAEARFRQTIMEYIQDDPWLAEHPPRINRLASGFGSAETKPDHPLVTALSESAEEELRTSPTVAAAPYGCDMSGWVRLSTIPTVIYGLGDISLAHAPDESVSLDTTYKVARALVRITERLREINVESLRLTTNDEV